MTNDSLECMLKLSSENIEYIRVTNACVIVSEAEERQLEVEVLVYLWHRIVNVRLVIPVVAGVAALVEEPVHELGPDLLQPRLGHDVIGRHLVGPRGVSIRLRFVRVCKILIHPTQAHSSIIIYTLTLARARAAIL